MKLATIVGGLVGGWMACTALAAPEPASAPAAPQQVVPLWPGEAPGSAGARQVEKETPMPGGKTVATRNVVKPTLTVYLPSPDKATGTGVVIAPGGGFRFLTMAPEGHDVARWLAQRGIAAFVLKYRVVETPENDAEMWKQMIEIRKALSDGRQLPNLDEDGKAGIADGMRAVEIVRQRAREWGVALDRIGFLGFSAGGVVTSHVALRAPEAARPNFAAPIYGAPFGELPAITASTPPFFLAYSSDDMPGLVGRIQALYAALRTAGHHPELRVYRNGGHGYGLDKQGLSSDFWIEDFYNWLRSLGLTERAAAAR